MMPSSLPPCLPQKRDFNPLYLIILLFIAMFQNNVLELLVLTFLVFLLSIELPL